MTSKFSPKKFISAVKAFCKAHPENTMENNANFLGVHRSTLYYWFNGAKIPSEDTAKTVKRSIRGSRTRFVQNILVHCP